MLNGYNIGFIPDRAIIRVRRSVTIGEKKSRSQSNAGEEEH